MNQSYMFFNVDTHSDIAKEKRNGRGKVKKGAFNWTAYGILDEVDRVPEQSKHVKGGIQPPIWHCGSRAAVEAAGKEWQATKITSLNRKPKSDTCWLLSIVTSIPNELRPQWRSYIARTLKWAKKRYGKQLRAVVEHTDEKFAHLHLYVVPKPGQPFWSIHQGYEARFKERERLKPLIAQAKADGITILKSDKKFTNHESQEYRDAMRRFQDEAFEEVGTHFDLARVGPKRKRVDRATWLLMNQEENILQFELKQKKQAEMAREHAEKTEALAKEHAAIKREAAELKAEKEQAKISFDAERAALLREKKLIQEKQHEQAVTEATVSERMKSLEIKGRSESDYANFFVKKLIDAAESELSLTIDSASALQIFLKKVLNTQVDHCVAQSAISRKVLTAQGASRALPLASQSALMQDQSALQPFMMITEVEKPVSMANESTTQETSKHVNLQQPPTEIKSPALSVQETKAGLAQSASTSVAHTGVDQVKAVVRNPEMGISARQFELELKALEVRQENPSANELEQFLAKTITSYFAKADYRSRANWQILELLLVQKMLNRFPDKPANSFDLIVNRCLSVSNDSGGAERVSGLFQACLSDKDAMKSGVYQLPAHVVTADLVAEGKEKIAIDYQRRLDQLPSLLKKSYGATSTVADLSLQALAEAKKTGSEVRWDVVSTQAIQQATKNGRPLLEVYKALIECCPGVADPALRDDLLRQVNSIDPAAPAELSLIREQSHASSNA